MRRFRSVLPTLSSGTAASLCLMVFLMPSQAMGQVTSMPSADGGNLVRNGSFQDVAANGVPTGWHAEGRKEIKQVVVAADGPGGRKGVKLTCTHFVPGTPDSHAMIAQRGAMGAKKGQFYRVTWWAKEAAAPGETEPAFSARIDLTSCVLWNRFYAEDFPVYPTWRRYERVFQAPDDLPAGDSRLSFSIRTTGVLWISDVVITAEAGRETRRQWWPRISVEGVTNLLPNSSFECGPDGPGCPGWGGYAPDVTGLWGNRTNLPALVGEIDATTGWDGQRSLRIHIDKNKLLVVRSMFQEAVYQKEKVTSIAVANLGWIPLAAGERYVFSCYLKADQADTKARLLVCQPGPDISIHLASQSFKIGTEWQRVVLPVKASEATFVWVAAGLDMTKSPADAGTLWLDALQFEKGDKPSEYAPRSKVESFLASSVAGNIFTDPAAGMNLNIVVCNAGEAASTVKGKLSIADFWDKEIFAQDVELPVPAKGQARFPLDGILKGRTGFFRATWQPADHSDPFPQTLRCAMIDEYRGDDSPFGMNCAYPWPLQNQLARKAGVLWMRDWTPCWEIVEPKKGKFDFSAPDAMIGAILAERQNAVALLPSPSAKWSSSADLAKIDQEVKKTDPEWRRDRLICAWPAKDLADFKNYVARTVEHYQQEGNKVRCFEIFNEPLYGGPLPGSGGFKMKDYIDLLKLAYESAKGVNKGVQVIGGISTWPNDPLNCEFIRQGGLAWCDVMNLHWYPPAGTVPESSERDLAAIAEAMRAGGEHRPIWMTEFGCYGDDDPPFTANYQFGDNTMQRCLYASESDAARDLVKYSCILFGHGTTKVFFHQGSSGVINGGTIGGEDTMGVFFKYGGAPRKMYPALSVLANVMGPDFEPLGSDNKGPCYAYWFRTKNGSAAVVWKNEYAEGAEEGKPVVLTLRSGVSAMDIMGNRVDGPTVHVTETPVYLLSADEGVWKDLLK